MIQFGSSHGQNKGQEGLTGTYIRTSRIHANGDSHFYNSKPRRLFLLINNADCDKPQITTTRDTILYNFQEKQVTVV